MELPETNIPEIAGENRKRRGCLYYLLLLALGIVGVVVLVIVFNSKPEGETTQNLFSQLVSDPTVIWIAVISFVVAAVIFVIAEIIAKKKK